MKLLEHEKIAKKLREAGFEVWMAQESLLIVNGTDEEKRSIHEIDIRTLKESNV